MTQKNFASNVLKLIQIWIQKKEKDWLLTTDFSQCVILSPVNDFAMLCTFSGVGL